MPRNFEIRRHPPEEGEELSAAAERQEAKNPKTGMSHREEKEFIRNHFEEFVKKKNPGIAIWRIANRQIVEPWAYLEGPHPVQA
jgi:hypothetical protein